jgi:hypothetical protein
VVLMVRGGGVVAVVLEWREGNGGKERREIKE